MSITKRIGIILGPLLFVLTIYFFNPEDLSKEGIAVLATALWVAVWWITEAVPIATAALLPIVLFPISGGLSLSETTASYGHKFVFLYLGGFMIAIAIEKWNLHKRIALSIINAIGTNIQRIILGFMVATGFISMWISNTATAVMMLPIGMAIVTQLNDNPNTKANENLIFGKALMLGIAYSASIGGIATLIGTPPNPCVGRGCSRNLRVRNHIFTMVYIWSTNSYTFAFSMLVVFNSYSLQISRKKIPRRTRGN